MKNLNLVMNKTLLNAVLIVCICFAFINCANRGNPDGGPKDEIPPVIVKEVPENYSTNFKGNEIRVYFDEYIKIKDIQKQLIISPPMKTPPIVTPLGGASKFITIKIQDTLKPNTTYAFNFGNSITDNNEGNPFPYYRYVLSTGDYIDSLKVTGNIAHALYKKPETFVNVALYEVDSTFTDSIVYKEVPKYITNTLDSVTTFSIENIKAGKYMLMALKDANGDNKFQQKVDQIAFHKSFITVPTDSSYTLKLFSEDIDFKATRPFIIANKKIAFGYEGDHKDMRIEMLSKVPDTFSSRVVKDEKTDSLYYWYRPRLEVDSLLFKVTHPNFEKEFTVRIRPQENDSLAIKMLPSGVIRYDEPVFISANVPFVNIDKSKISLIDKDSTVIDFNTTYDSISNTYAINFNKTLENAYKMQLLPGAVTDLYEETNDTLNFSVKTKAESDFGYARFTFSNAKFPLIVQLTSDKGEVKYEEYVTEDGRVDFLNLNPNKYFIRVIHDTNGNKKFDKGNYLKKRQPERVSHFNMIEIRADWGTEENLLFN